MSNNDTQISQVSMFLIPVSRFNIIELNLYVLSLLSGIGFAIGFIGGTVGLVLGVLRFPFILSSEASIAATAGTNIGVSTMGAAIASIQHFRQNNVNTRIFLIMGLTGAIGAFIGSLFTRYMPISILLIGISVIVLYEAYLLIRSSKIIKTEQNQTHTSMNRTIWKESLIGFAIGFLGGLVGLVLGSIRLPTMISVFKMNIKTAVGTNLAASALMGVFGLLGHIINYEVDFVVLSVMGVAAMIGGFAGARYSQRFSDKSIKKILGIVLIAVGVTMFIRAIILGF